MRIITAKNLDLWYNSNQAPSASDNTALIRENKYDILRRR